MIKHILAVLTIGLIAAVGLAYYYKNQTKILDSELGEISARHEVIKSHLEYQNKEIERASEALKTYYNKVSQIEKEYNLKLSAYEKQIAKIKTCDDGFQYLKNMLDDLKGIQ